MKISEISLLGHRAFGFNMYRDLRDDVAEVEVEEIEAPNTSLEKSLFDLVFSVDPRTNLPIGDIAQYLSNETHPDVKRFIELNLHAPISIDGDAHGDLAGLSDMDIADLTRHNSESLIDYRNRVMDYLRDNMSKSEPKSSE